MSDARRIVIRQTGGPEVLELATGAIPAPGASEVLIENGAIGVNFIDTYHRTGLYPIPLPSGIGGEGAGRVVAVGEGVDPALIGRRTAYLLAQPGAYASHVAVATDGLYPLPDALSDEQAAAVLLKGLTCWMLIEAIARAGPDTTILVHAAAGGVGSLAVQWLNAIGATVIAHAGTAAKAAAAKAAGADHALHCGYAALGDAVRDLTDGRGADVVFDGIGKASWAASLAATAKRGMIVSYGNASGAVPPVAPLDLLRAGSLFLTRPTVFDYLATPAMRATAAHRLFGLIGSGAITAAIGRRFRLDQAADAHRALEARTTTGSTILLP